MNKLIVLTLLVAVSSCGKNSGGGSGSSRKSNLTPFDISRLQIMENKRLVDLAAMNSDEVLRQAEFPLTSIEGSLKFLDVINKKLSEGTKISDLTPHVWLLLESIHKNWTSDNKAQIKEKLTTFGTQNEELEGMINLFLQSEGINPITEKGPVVAEATDPNYQQILERKNILISKEILSLPENLNLWVPHKEESPFLKIAANDLIYSSLKDQSLGLPVENKNLETNWNLPAIKWTGTLYAQRAKPWNISAEQINGKRYGAKKDRGAGSNSHAYLTPNMSSQNKGDSIDYNLSITSEVKGGTKKRTDGSNRDKHSTVAIDIVGQTTIPQCVDLTKCSSFLILQVNRYQLVSNSSAYIKINGEVFDLKAKQLIDRTNGPTDIEIGIKANRKHSGKSGAIHDTLSIGISIFQESTAEAKELNISSLQSSDPSSYLQVNKWAKDFESGLINNLKSDDTGSYIFRHIKYFHEISKNDELDVTQLSAIKVLNSFIINEANIRYAPIINKLINEKRKTILRLPTAEIEAILSESLKTDTILEASKSHKEQLNETLAKFGKKDKSFIISDEKFAVANQKQYLLVNLYKNLNDQVVSFASELEKDIQQMDAEMAQLQHLVLEPEEGMNTHEMY